MTEFVKPSEPESSEVMSISVPKLDSSEKTSVVNGNIDSIHAEHARDLQLVPDDIEEIVQIPLDDNDVRDLQLQDTMNVENDDAVPECSSLQIAFIVGNHTFENWHNAFDKKSSCVWIYI